MPKYEAKPCRLGTSSGSEEGWLCLKDDVIFAILVREGGNVGEKQGWYLQIGFGPCEAEGLVFGSVEQALQWLKERTGKKGRAATLTAVSGEPQVAQERNIAIRTVTVIGSEALLRSDGRAAIRIDTRELGSIALEVDQRAIDTLRRQLASAEQFLRQQVGKA